MNKLIRLENGGSVYYFNKDQVAYLKVSEGYTYIYFSKDNFIRVVMDITKVAAIINSHVD